MSRNFVSEFENENRRNLNENTIVRRRQNDQQEDNDDIPLADMNKDESSSSVHSSPRVDLPEGARANFESANSSTWWKKTSRFAQTHSRELKIGIFAIVMILSLILLTSVASQSGQTPDAIMPRLVFFLVDGVTVKEFKEAAASRRVPSMNFFAQQSENCRPLVSANSGDDDYFSHPFDRCVMSDPSSHTGTLFSLLTGAAFTSTTGQITLQDIEMYNFTTFLRKATQRGLTSAVLGNTPIVTIANTPSSTSAETPSGASTTLPPVGKKICGILDSECALNVAKTSSISSSCHIPSTAANPLNSMITSSSSCNVAFQSLVLDTDTPDQIWNRVKYVLKEDVDVLFVQIPQATVNKWQEERQVGIGGAAGANKEFSRDAALYDVDRIFSKILRDITVRSAQQGEEWLSFLAVSSAEQEPDLLLASNIIKNGNRQDVDALLDSSMQQMSPDRLNIIIDAWLSRK